MTVREYQHLSPPGVVTTFPSTTQALRRLWDALFRARQGKLDCIVEFTLTANAATTTLTDIRLSNQSVVTLDPKTANAAAEKAAGTVYCLTANRIPGAWVFTHANNAQTDRDFQVSILG